MRIRIDDQFDDKTELEYDTVDNDSIIGNGVLGNDCSIIEVKDFKEVKEENNDSIHEDNKYKYEKTLLSHFYFCFSSGKLC